MNHINHSQETSATTRVHGSALPAWKRAADLVCCALILPLLALVVLLMTVITACVSPGPVIFKQERIGHGGRRFMLYKFRTMTVGADTTVHAQHVRELMSSRAPMEKLDTRGDARLIPGGWLLRASGLDELPQVINVLQGEMSLVGPRPCLPVEFDAAEPGLRERVAAVPGLTGLWQVSGKNRTTYEEMIRLDVHYARQLSPWLDGRIVLLTPWVLVRQVFETARNRRGGKRRPASKAAQPRLTSPAKTVPVLASYKSEASAASPSARAMTPASR